jgi:hypothetical protein
VWRFCAFLNKGSSTTPYKLFGESPCQKLLAEKVEKKNFFPVVFSLRFFLIALLAVSLREEPKSTIKILSLYRSPKAPQKLQGKVSR